MLPATAAIRSSFKGDEMKNVSIVSVALPMGGHIALPVGLIDSWLKNLVVGWLAKAIGISEADLLEGLDALISFIKALYKFFGPKEAVKVLKYGAKNPTRVFKAVQTAMVGGK